MPHSRYFPQDIKSELKGRMVLVICTDTAGLHFRSFPSDDPGTVVSRYHPENEDVHRVYGGINVAILATLEREGYYDSFAEGQLELKDLDRMLVKPSFLEDIRRDDEEAGR